MPRVARQNRLPGICDRCYLDQMGFPDPEFFYCRHTNKLLARRDYGYESFDLKPEELERLLTEMTEVTQ